MATAASIWTEPRIELLRRRYEQRMSAQLIADEMGCTRSSVMGKLHRLHLKRPVAVVAMGPKGIRKVRNPSTHPSRNRESFLPKVEVNVTRKRLQPAVFEGPLNIPWADLGETTCHWPVNQTKPLIFCGRPTANSRTSYCCFHLQLSH